jgi:hypothetical protein
MCRRGQLRKLRQKADLSDLTYSQYSRRLVNADLEYAMLRPLAALDVTQLSLSLSLAP